MPRLIDATELRKAIEAAAPDSDSPYYVAVQRGLYIAIDKIITAPTIDAEPVRHGRWIYDDEITELQGCSVCGEFDKRTAVPPKRCDHCGAKMDSEE
jgi:hypothetical protein